MDRPDAEAACREIICEWRDLAELAKFAEERHGYGNSDGGFGVIYPEDLDGYQLNVEKIHIPQGELLLYGYAHVTPPGYETLVSEKTYLGVLAEVLAASGFKDDAERLIALINEKSA